MYKLLCLLTQTNSKLPKIDLTITITVVIAVCAIISPVLTALINNHHLYKMKKLDMKLEYEKSSAFYKRGIFETYVKTTGKCIFSRKDEDIKEYGAIYPLALLYFPDELRPDLEELNQLIIEEYWKEAGISLSNISPKIRKMLQTM